MSEIITFIVFKFPLDDQHHYFDHYYIRESIASWQREFPNSRIVYFDVDVLLSKTKSLYTKICLSTHGYSCYLTDCLRFEVMTQYDNCVYCDTDVFFLPGSGERLRRLMSKYDRFILQDCSGTFAYNKHKSSDVLGKTVKIYDKYNTASDKILTDIDMYRSVRPMRELWPSFWPSCLIFHASHFWPYSNGFLYDATYYSAKVDQLPSLKRHRSNSEVHFPAVVRDFAHTAYASKFSRSRPFIILDSHFDLRRVKNLGPSTYVYFDRYYISGVNDDCLEPQV